MPKLFGKCWTKSELLQHIGSVDQVGGARRFMLVDGNTAGAEAVEFRTGTGLRFVVGRPHRAPDEDEK